MSERSRTELTARVAELTRALEQERAAWQAGERSPYAALDSDHQQLARRLHDTLSQSLNAARIYARVIRSAAERSCPEASESSATLEQVARHAAEELQTLLRWLRPARLDGAALVARLTELAELASRAVPCEVRGPAEVHAEPEMEAELLRIAQLALHGLVGRSGATSIELELERDEQGLLLTARASGGGVMPNEWKTALEGRARSFGGIFATEHAPEGLTLSCRLPATVSGISRTMREVADVTPSR